MKIIISTYNFYPEFTGGTEVYTFALARYLRAHGHEVLIIAAINNIEAVGECTLVTESPELKIVEYVYQGYNITGVHFTRQSVEDVYTTENTGWTRIFGSYLKGAGWQNATHFIMSGFNTVSGLSLYKAVQQLNASIDITVIVHTPFLCPRADMINCETGNRCTITMTAQTCSSCLLTAQTKIPYPLSKAFTFLVNGAGLPRFIRAVPIRLKQLVEQRMQTFSYLGRNAGQWIVFAEDMKTFIGRQNFISASQVHVIRHGIDKSIFYKGSEKSSTPLKFLYAGRFEEVKGIRLLCEAWLRIPENAEQRILYLTGNWKSTETGKEIIEVLKKRKDVIILEGLTQTELAGLYRSVHCVTIPSKWVETGPMTFHEAIACGCDIISSDIGGQGELVQLYKRKAVSFKSGNSESLYNAILHYQPSAKEEKYDVYSATEHFHQLTKTLRIL